MPAAIVFFEKFGTIVPTNKYLHARLAQLVEQLVYTEKVGSSSLSSRTRPIDPRLYSLGSIVSQI